MLYISFLDAEGLIEGEYGFITIDGIYHETAYVVDKDGDFIVTRMRHRKISNCEFIFFMRNFANLIVTM